MMSSRLAKTLLFALPLLLLQAQQTWAQGTTVADTAQWRPAEMAHGLDQPDRAATFNWGPEAPTMDGFPLPSLPQLQQPEVSPHDFPHSKTLSPGAIKAMTLDPLDLQLMAAMPQPRFSVDPHATDYSRSGVLLAWRSGFIGAAGSQRTQIGLMATNSASFTATQIAGRWVFTSTVSADHYRYGRAAQWQLGVGATATYMFSPNFSATVFGNYYTGTTYMGLSTLPYMGSSNYGGFLTMQNDRLGLDLGVERVYNPYTGRWETVPIVTPKVRIAQNFVISLPVGFLIKEAIDGSIESKRRKPGAIIAPDIPAINPRFTQPPGQQNNF